MNQINFKDMKKLLFFLLSTLVLSSCGNYQEYKKKRDLYINNSAYYIAALNIISEDPNMQEFFPNYKTYPDSIHKYELLLNNLHN